MRWVSSVPKTVKDSVICIKTDIKQLKQNFQLYSINLRESKFKPLVFLKRAISGFREV